MFDQFESRGVFAPLYDTLTEADPWGIGITCTWLRIDHDDWTSFQSEQAQKSEVVIGSSQAQIASMVKASAITASRKQDDRPGFRARRKPTKAEADQGDGERQAELERQLNAEIDDRISKIPIAKLLGGGEGLEMTRAHIAMILLRGWSGVTSGGRPIEFTLANRLKFLGYEGALVWLPLDTPGVPNVSRRRRELAGNVALNPIIIPGDEIFAVDPASALGKAIRGPAAIIDRDVDPKVADRPGVSEAMAQGKGFHGNPRDASGNLQTMSRDPWEGDCLGDALCSWGLDAGKRASEGRTGAVAEAVEGLESGPSGTPATTITSAP